MEVLIQMKRPFGQGRVSVNMQHVGGHDIRGLICGQNVTSGLYRCLVLFVGHFSSHQFDVYRRPHK